MMRLPKCSLCWLLSLLAHGYMCHQKQLWGVWRNLPYLSHAGTHFCSIEFALLLTATANGAALLRNPWGLLFSSCLWWQGLWTEF